MTEKFDQFQGTATYIASDELKHAVNVAVALARPLLVRGEPGTGKTQLAEAIAATAASPSATRRDAGRSMKSAYHAC